MTRRDGFNLKTLFPSYNETYLPEYNELGDHVILFFFTIVFCIIGLVGNGYIVWLLGFRIRRKPFAIYILNLAVADFGSLVFLLPLDIIFNLSLLYDYDEFTPVYGKLLMSLFLLMYSSCQLLLTAFSIDRWLSVCFPNWYQRHQSPVVSTTVCTFIWVLSFALSGGPLFLELMDFMPEIYGDELVFAPVVNSLIDLLIVIISTLSLFTKVCCKSQPSQGRNLWNVIFLMLLSFLLFTILTNVCLFMMAFISPAYIFLWISLKGSINPPIYFLAGRQNGGQFQEKMKVILQRVFKEERDTRMELQPHTQTVL